jgi:hypothetical protein
VVGGIQVTANGSEVSRHTLGNGAHSRCKQEQDHRLGEEKPPFQTQKRVSQTSNVSHRLYRGVVDFISVCCFATTQQHRDEAATVKERLNALGLD